MDCVGSFEMLLGARPSLRREHASLGGRSGLSKQEANREQAMDLITAGIVDDLESSPRLPTVIRRSPST